MFGNRPYSRFVSFFYTNIFNEGGSSMNDNTALSANAQSAQVQSTERTHMVFADREHEEFYYEMLGRARYQDCYHQALIYVLGISRDTREHFDQIYNIKTGGIKPRCLNEGWQTSGSVRVVRLAFNLYTDGTPSVDNYKRKDEQVGECKPNPQDWAEYIHKRYFLLWICRPSATGSVLIGRA